MTTPEANTFAYDEKKTGRERELAIGVTVSDDPVERDFFAGLPVEVTIRQASVLEPQVTLRLTIAGAEHLAQQLLRAVRDSS